MNVLLKTLAALGLFLALDASAFSTLGASASELLVTHRHAAWRHHHHITNFDRANALASPSAAPLAPLPRPSETDGLSRNDEDCNYGCIDH